MAAISVLRSGVLRSLCRPRPAQLHTNAARLNGVRGRGRERQDYTQLQLQADESVRSAISRSQSVQAADWDRIAQEYRQCVPDAKLDRIDHRTLLICKQLGDLKTARSLMQHRKATNTPVPVPTLSLYMEMAGCCSAGDPRAEDEVLRLHQQLSCLPLDGKSAGRAVLGLCGTRHWRQALHYVRGAPGEIHNDLANPLACAAFRHGDHELGWKFMRELATTMARPSDEAFQAWLSQCEARARLEVRSRLSASTGAGASSSLESAGETASDMLQRLLTFLADSGFLLTEEQARRVKDLCSSGRVERWTAAPAQLSGKGRCDQCGLVLPEAVLSDADFAEIREALVDRVLIGDDIFQRSTPEELERFRSFVARTAPYDVVVDSLNISYTLKHVKGLSPLNSVMRHVVHHFAVVEGKKVLVIGRYHMRGWNRKDMGFIKRHALLFNADNMSADDAFLLYAVLHSHQRTLFVTRDLFRDHGANMPDVTRAKFNQLVLTNRVEVAPAARHGSLAVTMPLRHLVRAQVDPHGGWHVPFAQRPPNSLIVRTPDAVVTDRWLCLRPSTGS